MFLIIIAAEICVAAHYQTSKQIQIHTTVSVGVESLPHKTGQQHVLIHISPWVQTTHLPSHLLIYTHWYDKTLNDVLEMESEKKGATKTAARVKN